jgi:hypothetical protein
MRDTAVAFSRCAPYSIPSPVILQSLDQIFWKAEQTAAGVDTDTFDDRFEDKAVIGNPFDSRLESHGDSTDLGYPGANSKQVAQASRGSVGCPDFTHSEKASFVVFFDRVAACLTHVLHAARFEELQISPIIDPATSVCVGIVHPSNDLTYP